MLGNLFRAEGTRLSSPRRSSYGAVGKRVIEIRSAESTRLGSQLVSAADRHVLSARMNSNLACPHGSVRTAAVGY